MIWTVVEDDMAPRRVSEEEYLDTHTEGQRTPVDMEEQQESS